MDVYASKTRDPNSICPVAAGYGWITGRVEYCAIISSTLFVGWFHGAGTLCSRVEQTYPKLKGMLRWINEPVLHRGQVLVVEPTKLRGIEVNVRRFDNERTWEKNLHRRYFIPRNNRSPCIFYTKLDIPSQRNRNNDIWRFHGKYRIEFNAFAHCTRFNRFKGREGWMVL